MTRSYSGPGDDDDRVILGYSREFFSRLGIKKPEPDTVSWVPNNLTGGVFVAHGEVRLPREIRGRMVVEDLRPLIASAVIHSYIMAPRSRRALFTRLVLPIALGEIPLVFGILEAVRSPPNIVLVLLFGIIVTWTIYGVRWMVLLFRYQRRLFLDSDSEAAKLVAKTELKEALAKLEELDLEPKSPLARSILRPSLKQRMERLDKS